ncbi:MAG TPA: Ig-like domain-containing protein, partial [Tepidisphaeraceae bacterium]
GAGDALILRPKAPLEANKTYVVYFNYNPNFNRITDVNGNAYGELIYRFTTGSVLPPVNPDIKFSQEQVAGGLNSGTSNNNFTATTIGPDGRLYAATTNGTISRWTINIDGTLSGRQDIQTIITSNGANRIITGITFDPGSTADNLVLWVSHGQYRFGNYPDGSTGEQQKTADNFTGKISVLSGPDLGTSQDMIVGIPRASKDHLNNQIVFDPDKRHFYFTIPSMNAMGRADPIWSLRDENIFSAATLRVRFNGETGLNAWVSARSAPINLTINETTGATRYNIYKGSNPVRLFATGIRNAYDLLFHSNGRLYAGVNGSSAGGNTPATPDDISKVPNSRRIDYNGSNPYEGPTAPALENVPFTEPDSLIDMKEGGYYGHPNPTRGEYILNAGNLTNGVDPFEVRSYGVGQEPDRNYRYPVYNFGNNYSPNGLIEYKYDKAFHGLLNGYILVARFSSGADLFAIRPGSRGAIDTNLNGQQDDGDGTFGERIEGLSGLARALDMVQDPNTGNIYVVQLAKESASDGNNKITVLRPQVVPNMANAAPSASRLSFYVEPGDREGITKTVSLTNTGTTSLIVDVSATKLTGINRRNFRVFLPEKNVVIAPGASAEFKVKGVLAEGQAKAVANLAFATNDPDGTYSAVIPLRAFDIDKSSNVVQPVERRVAFSSTPVAQGGSAASFFADTDDDDEVDSVLR